MIGQAMVAACRTVEGRLPHSIHCYFILPGDPQIPIIYQVERLRDGKSYSTRRVTAIQHGNAIFSIMVSFHAEEEGAFNHQEKMPDVPPPEKLTAEEVSKQPMFKEMPEFIRRYYEIDRPIELRPVELGRYFGQKIDDGRINVWIRTAAKLPDDPALHLCALAYASDFSLLDAVMARYGRTLFDKQRDAGQPRSRDVVSPAVPRRRMAALRAGFTERAGRPRIGPRPDLQARRHAGGVGGPGRLDRQRSGHSAFRRDYALPVAAARLARPTPVCDASHCAHPSHHPRNGNDEDPGNPGHDGAPQTLPVRCR